MTLGEFAPVFFTKRKMLMLTHSLSAASYKADEVRFSKIHLELGASPLKELTPCRIDQYLDSLILRDRSSATRNRYRALLHTFFKYAVQLGHIDKNPVADIIILSEKLKSRPVDFLNTLGEVECYIKAASALSPVFGIGATILCFGGCRIGEALALQFQDIEWDKSYVRIRKTHERHSRKVVNRTKGQKAGGEYQMLLVPKLRDALEQWKGSAFFKAPEDFILHKPTGKPFCYDSYYKAHKKILLSAGIKPIRLHDLRRTFAIAAERAGFHRGEVGDLLGHENTKSTDAYLQDDMSNLVEKSKRLKFFG